MGTGEKVFMWKGVVIKSYGQVMDAAVEIIELPSPKAEEVAARFMEEYAAVCGSKEVASKNVGYMSGYYDTETATKIRKIFCVTHPIFGDRNPTPEEAIKAGMSHAKDI